MSVRLRDYVSDKNRVAWGHTILLNYGTFDAWRLHRRHTCDEDIELAFTGLFIALRKWDHGNNRTARIEWWGTRTHRYRLSKNRGGCQTGDKTDREGGEYTIERMTARTMRVGQGLHVASPKKMSVVVFGGHYQATTKCK